jgi:hypothetical protein
VLDIYPVTESSTFADEEQNRSVTAKLYSLLLTPVYQWIRVPAVTLKNEDLQDTVRVLSFTAPFAALIVHRLRLALKYCLERSDEDDSMDLEEADDGIVTDQEEYERPNPYKASQIPESSIAGSPPGLPLPDPPTNAMLEPLPPLFFPATPTTQESLPGNASSQEVEEDEDTIQEFSMAVDDADPIED